jgi:hypothetical protein
VVWIVAVFISILQIRCCFPLATHVHVSHYGQQAIRVAFVLLLLPLL